MLKNLDIGLIRTFVTVAETQNMTKAADGLFLTQGAVSQQIRRLEESLEVRLFDRHRRTLKLTSRGVAFLKQANGLLELNDAIISETVVPEIVGVVRLGVPFDLVTDYLPIVLQDFAENYPEIEVSLYCEASGKLIEMVANDELDIAIAEEPMESAKGECLCTQPLVWIGHARVLKHQPLPLSVVSKTCVFRPAIHKALKDAGIEWRAVFENGNLEAAITTVRAGLAISASLIDSVPRDLQVLTTEDGLPPLPNFSISLHQQGQRKVQAVNRLADNIRKAFVSGLSQSPRSEKLIPVRQQG